MMNIVMCYIIMGYNGQVGLRRIYGPGTHCRRRRPGHRRSSWVHTRGSARPTTTRAPSGRRHRDRHRGPRPPARTSSTQDGSWRRRRRPRGPRPTVVPRSFSFCFGHDKLKHSHPPHLAVGVDQHGVPAAPVRDPPYRLACTCDTTEHLAVPAVVHEPHDTQSPAVDNRQHVRRLAPERSPCVAPARNSEPAGRRTT